MLSVGDIIYVMIDVVKWCESGSLIGIIFVVLLLIWLGYMGFGIVLMVLILCVGWLSCLFWIGVLYKEDKFDFKVLIVLGGGNFLVLICVNILFVVIIFMFFVFFVEDCLMFLDVVG